MQDGAGGEEHVIVDIFARKEEGKKRAKLEFMMQTLITLTLANIALAFS